MPGGLKERGESFDGYQVTVSLSAIVTKDNPDTVWERLRPHYQYRRAFFDKIIAEFGDTPLSGTPAGEIATAATKPGVYGDEMVGSPDTILRNLEDLRATWSWDGLKPTELIIRTPPPGVPLKEFESSFELFVREIMPVVAAGRRQRAIPGLRPWRLCDITGTRCARPSFPDPQERELSPRSRVFTSNVLLTLGHCSRKVGDIQC